MKTYLLVLRSYNLTTTINVDLTPKEYELMKDINYSMEKQKAQIVLDVEEIE